MGNNSQLPASGLARSIPGVRRRFIEVSHGIYPPRPASSFSRGPPARVVPRRPSSGDGGRIRRASFFSFAPPPCPAPVGGRAADAVRRRGPLPPCPPDRGRL